MNKQSESIALQEYTSLRQEMYEIIRGRYTILTANIAFVGVVIGAITQDILNNEYRKNKKETNSLMMFFQRAQNL